MRGKKPLTPKMIDMKLSTPNGTLYETVEHEVNGDNHAKIRSLEDTIELEFSSTCEVFPSRATVELTDEQARQLTANLLDELQDK